MYRRFIISSQSFVVFAAAALVALTGLHAPHSAASSGGATVNTKIVTIAIREFKIDPEKVTVRAGDTVEWRNDDSVPHTVTAEMRGDSVHFDSKAIANGASWRYIGKTRGKYTYTCTYHPNMEGTLIVQ